ncbi:MAG: flagellar basal body P-ring protein FlgI, partial [Planctomycetes bacterium]|nr:flagellar basal body P-ring protein FlgI [Planctomycetota bacterium]
LKAVQMLIMDPRGVVRFHLKNQDWNTATNVERVINEKHVGVASAINAGVIDVVVPREWHDRVTEFIAGIHDLLVPVHMVSRVIVDEKMGIIVAGANVRISRVAVAHGQFSVTIQESPQAVVANPFTEGPSIGAIPRSNVVIDEESAGLKVVQGGESVAELASSLNALGASPRQLIGILQSIKAAGALHADLEVR